MISAEYFIKGYRMEPLPISIDLSDDALEPKPKRIAINDPKEGD